PEDNPFFRFGALLRRSGQPELGANLQKVFSFGHRNGFGHDFEPIFGDLWISENADDAFSEINRVEPGMNGGWIQIMGPLRRYDQFRTIEQTLPPVGLQQLRWPPSNLAPGAASAFSRLFFLPGSHYSDPE